MRKSDVYLLFAAAGAAGLFLLLSVYPVTTAGFHREKIEEARALVKQLHLTDLCLFTEARYTRNVTQTDLHSPFQDHPVSIEHFPSGSLVSPPTPREEHPS